MPKYSNLQMIHFQDCYICLLWFWPSTLKTAAVALWTEQSLLNPEDLSSSGVVGFLCKILLLPFVNFVGRKNKMKEKEAGNALLKIKCFFSFCIFFRKIFTFSDNLQHCSKYLKYWRYKEGSLDRGLLSFCFI